MKKHSKQARYHLDKRFDQISHWESFDVPQKGWIRAVRDSLGMTTRQLAKRMGISQTSAVSLEKNEISGAITLQSLKKAADAMHCRLVYAVVPEESLEAIVQSRAIAVATKMFEDISHSMRLENQEVIDPEDKEAQIEKLAEELADDIKRLWD